MHAWILIALAHPCLVQAVAISRPPAHNVAPHQVTVWWGTDVSASTEIAWGPASQPSFGAYPNSRSTSGEVGTLHGHTFTSLAPGTYFYRVRATDTGGSVESGEGTFAVPVPDEHVPLGTVVFDGDVRMLLRIGDTAYLGGNFQEAGTRTGAGVRYDASTGVLPGPQVAGRVDVAIPDGAGGFYIGGAFHAVGGLSRSGLAHILPDGGLDPDFAPAPNAAVLALALSGTALFIGGDFTTVGGTARSFAAAVDPTTGALLAWDPAPNGGVRALALSGSTVYLAGSFTSINGGTARNRAAAVSAATGVATGWDPNLNAQANALAISGATLYVGGQFTTANGGTVRNRAAAFDDTAGVVTSWDPNLSGEVLSLASTAGAIYAGGSFTTVNGGTARNHAAAFDPISGAATAWDPNLDGIVQAVRVQGTEVLVAGQFFTANLSVSRWRAAAFDLTSGVATGWDPHLNGNAGALAVDGAVAFLGGDFTGAGPATPRKGLAAVSASTGALLAWAPEVNGTVEALAATATTLYAGGDFTTVNGSLARNRAAAFDLVTGAPTGWDPNVSGVVLAMTLLGSTLYAGGNFSSVNGGLSRRSAAAFDLATGTATAWDPDAAADVRALAASGTTVYLGGNFEQMNGGAPRLRAAAVDATTGTISGWDPSVNGAVEAIALVGGTVYLGGAFNAVGGAGRNRAASVDAATGALAGWDPDVDNTVFSLAAWSTARVYLGGQFVTANGGAVRNRAAAVDPATGAVLAWDPNLGNRVDAIDMSCADDTVVMGGSFRWMGTVPQRGHAIARAGSACPAGSSAPTVTTLAASGIGTTAATLNGSANPKGTATTAWFRYATTDPGGCDDAFGTRVPAAGGVALGSGSADAPYSQPVAGLAPNTQYFFCAIASNAVGMAFGAVQSFTTGAVPPTVNTTAAAPVTRTGATLTGTANPNSALTTGWFRYAATDPGGCDDAFGTRVPAAGGVALGSGSAGAPYSQPVAGLAPNTQYFFCAIASNAGGMSFGSLASFTTSPNGRPVASAVGPAGGAVEGSVVVLDGTGSSDPDGDPLTFLWAQTGGPPVTLSSATDAAPTFVAPSDETPLTFTLVVRDPYEPSIAATVTVPVLTFPRIVSTAATMAIVGQPYAYDADQRIDATGTGPITFSLVAGPPGMVVQADGLISYVPTADGTYSVQLRAQSSIGSASQGFTLLVGTVPGIVSTPATIATAFEEYSYDADAAGTAPITWSLSAAPAGAAIDAATGAITWMPQSSGAAAFTVRAANGFGFEEQEFTVSVAEPIPRGYVVACGCGTGGVGGGVEVLWLLGVALLWRRRRRGGVGWRPRGGPHARAAGRLVDPLG